MRVAVIPHVLPLLFAYDATAEEGGEAGAGGVVGSAGGGAAAAEERGPRFMGLGIVRSNMQGRARPKRLAVRSRALRPAASACSRKSEIYRRVLSRGDSLACPQSRA